MITTGKFGRCKKIVINFIWWQYSRGYCHQHKKMNIFRKFKKRKYILIVGRKIISSGKLSRIEYRICNVNFFTAKKRAKQFAKHINSDDSFRYCIIKIDNIQIHWIINYNPLI